MRRLSIALLALLVVAPDALACAQATRFELRNETAQAVRAVYIDTMQPRGEPPSTLNRLPPARLAPGAVTSMTFPPCIGTYTLRAVLADGTERRHPDLDARRVRGVALRCAESAHG